MINITKLADKWRKGTFTKKVPDGGYGFFSGKRHCAQELESALPVWTRLTGDEATWPPHRGVFYMVYDETGDGDLFTAHGRSILPGEYWRPLCDLDYPPETES